jgi:hypothetical protein
LSKVQVDTIDTRSGTSTMQIGSTNTSTINIGVSGDTINIPSGVTIANAGTATGFGANTPAFAVRKTDGNQGYSQNTWTKVGFNLELLDTNNAFSSNTFTVPSGESGTYLFHVSVQMGSVGSGSAYLIKLYVNGSDYTTLVQYATSTAEFPIFGGVQAIDLSVGDYVEVFGLTNGGAGNFQNNLCQFTGFKLS